jgi:hypothetical protein
MKPRIEDYTPAKKCVHANEADNCLLCGTKPVSMTPLNQPLRSETPTYAPVRCRIHDQTNPCVICAAEDWRDQWQREQDARQVATINERSKSIWDEIRTQECEIRWPGGKCDHGHYLASDYCNVCSIALVEPDYDREKYRRAINIALRGARRLFGEAPPPETPKNDNIPVDSSKTEREKNFEDIKNLVDLEIWKASRAYGEKMSDKLAHYIARATAGRFITDLIDDETILVDVAWEFMSESLRAQGEALFQRVTDLDGLLRLSKDDRANEDDRALAKKIITEYGERMPRFASMDVPTESSNGEMNDGDNTSGAEYEFHGKQAAAAGRVPDTETLIAQYRPTLEALVRTWRGVQRLVGEAVLNGKTTYEVPGVPQSTAQKTRLVVLKSFLKHLKTKDL